MTKKPHQKQATSTFFFLQSQLCTVGLDDHSDLHQVSQASRLVLSQHRQASRLVLRAYDEASRTYGAIWDRDGRKMMDQSARRQKKNVHLQRLNKQSMFGVASVHHEVFVLVNDDGITAPPDNCKHPAQFDMESQIICTMLGFVSAANVN